MVENPATIAICFNISHLCVEGKDYKSKRYEVSFVRGRSRYGELTTEKKDDEYVEDDEYYFLKIVTELLPKDVVIDGPDTTKIILVNEDSR